MNIVVDLEDIPDRIYWESMLGPLEQCASDKQFERTAIEISRTLKLIRPCNRNVHFHHDVDVIDSVATSSLPSDGPQNVHAIKTKGDGNCVCRSVSHSYSGNDSMHLELRTRIVIDGILQKHQYMSHSCLSRSATLCREHPSLPHIYVTYSDHYVSGQRITENTVEYIYMRELHDVAKVNSYMGLWQIAQASSVIKMPIQSVYPEGTDPIMHQDFNRLFFPVDCDPANCGDMIMIMWTSVQPNCVPAHFVPLLMKRNK